MVTADALSRLLPLDEFEVPDVITPAKMQELKDETTKDHTL